MTSAPPENLSRTVKEWTAIINTILEKRPGYLTVESTDHEYRVDDRNILRVGRKKGHWSIDGLPHNIEQDKVILRALLATHADILAKGQ